ncbi:zinc knuckle CX2CX4HX4C containing protein [Tanacetum coccineum]
MAYFNGKRMAFSVVEYYARNNWAKQWMKRIMMNFKGFFFFKFDSRAGLDTSVLEGGLWLIRKSLIILKKCRWIQECCKEEFTRIPIWVKLHDVSIQVFEEDGISLIVTLIEADLVDVVTIDNLSMSNSFSALNDEEDDENVYDESANLIQNTKASGSSSFTACFSVYLV